MDTNELSIRQWLTEHPEVRTSIKAMQASLITHRILIHPGIGRSLHNLLLTYGGITYQTYLEMLHGNFTPTMTRATVARIMTEQQTVFQPGYVYQPSRNPYAAGTLGAFVWRALFFSMVRFNFVVDDEDLPLSIPQVNFYGEPLRGLLSEIIAPNVPAGHERTANICLDLNDTLTVGTYNQTARTAPEPVLKELAQSVGLSHNIWGDRLWNPDL